ncbi:MAG: exosortase/archaeosortase family protein [Phycisphaerales bacterium]|nr:exosortase/archaeosortase family protein [Phycisphaerales bacterium]
MPTSRSATAPGAPAREALRLAAAAVLFAWFFQRTLVHYFAYKWASDGNWSHGWLIPLISLYFLWTGKAELARTRRCPQPLAGVLLLGVLGAYGFYSWVRPILYYQGLCVPAGLAAVVLTLWGWRMLRATAFPIAYLLLAVPLPHGMYVELTVPLRRLASQLAGAALSLLPSVEVEVQKVVIDWVRLDTGASGYLNIETACSGLRLMMSFAALGLAYAYLLRGPMWQRIVIVLACVPIAVLCNAIRVILTGVFWIYDRPDWAQGTPHMLLGIVTLLIALGLFWALNAVMSRLWIETSEPDGKDATNADAP